MLTDQNHSCKIKIPYRKNQEERMRSNMKIKMLIATKDNHYSKSFSDHISEFYSDKIDICEYSEQEGVSESASKKKYDAALVDSRFAGKFDLSIVTMPILLWSDIEPAELPNSAAQGIIRIRKYQRISSIIAGVFEHLAKVSKTDSGLGSKSAEITAVWSPAGGVGKTTAALACATSKAAEGKDVFYLNLEDFSSVPGYFHEQGKSISSVFEMLDTQSGNIKMFIQGISCLSSGIKYLCCPNNYEDMYILSPENISDLIIACAGLTDELILDLPCIYDARTKKAFETAGKILIVTTPDSSANVKLAQFKSQNNAFEDIKEKVTIIINKNTTAADNVLTGAEISNVISLPLIDTGSPRDVYKALSKIDFS